MLAASPAARQALVHGLSLFQLAAVRLLHSAASGSQPRNLLATFDADAAQVAVQLTRSSLQQAADKVGMHRELAGADWLWQRCGTACRQVSLV